MASPVRLWAEHEERLVRFLLGNVSPVEQAEIEERLFAESELLDDLLAAGDDLIHAYLTESLSAEDKGRFETHFLASPLRRERFEFVRGVMAAAKQASARTRDAAWRRWALAAAVLVAAGWIGVRLGSDRSPIEQARQVTPSPSPAARPSASPIVPVETRTVRLPAETKAVVAVAVAAETRTVRLEVPIADDRHPTYDAVLRDGAGAAVWTVTDLVASGPGQSVLVEVPARILVAGSFALQIDGETLRDAPRAARTSVRYALRITRGAAPNQRQSP